MMTRTLEEFCDGLMADDHPMERLGPEEFAAEFSAYFQLPAWRGLNRLAELFERTGIGKVSPAKLPGTLRGIHYTLPDGSYAIRYQEGQWEGSSEYTLLHEGYEIVYETLWDRCQNEAPERKVCSEADRFAAAVLMPPETFAAYARASGLDVVALHRVFGCSYSAAALRLGEVLCAQPLAVILYERKEQGDPAPWLAPTRRRGPAGHGGQADGGIMAVPFPFAQRLAGRQAPQGQAPLRRFGGGEGGTQRQAGVYRWGRLGRVGCTRPLEGTVGQGGRGSRALGTTRDAGSPAWAAVLPFRAKPQGGAPVVHRLAPERLRQALLVDD